MTSLKEHKYLILLIVLVGALIVQSLHPTLATTPAVLNVLQTITVGAVFLGVFEQRRTRVVALWLGIVTAVVGWSEYALPSPYYPVASAVEHSLRMAFLGFAAIVILGDIFKKTLLRGAPRTCRSRNSFGRAKVVGSPRAEAVYFLVACDPGKKLGPGTVANLRVVTPAGDPD